jgi:hypothetical protein
MPGLWVSDRLDMTEILFKVALNTTTLTIVSGEKKLQVVVKLQFKTVTFFHLST